MPVKDAASFHEHFLRSWLLKQESLLRCLTAAPRGPAHDPDRRALVADAMAHQRAYFSAVRDLARCDAVLVLSPPWLSPEARAGFWMGGWRPAAAVRLATSVAGSVFEAPELQGEREKIRAEEERIEEEMERVQDRAVGAVVRWARGGRGEAVARAARALEKEVAAGIERVATAAEGLRMEVLRKVVEVLEPVQAVDFLAAVAVLQIGLHRTNRI